MSVAALSLAEFRELATTMGAPEIWVCHPVTFEQLEIPQALKDCATQLESPTARFADAVSPVDRSLFVKMSSAALTQSVDPVDLRYIDGVVRRTRTVQVEIPETRLLIVADSIGTHDLEPVESAPAPATGRVRTAGVAQLDAHAKIVTADAGCSSILGIDPERSVGEYPFEHVHPADYPVLTAVIGEARRKPASLAHAQLRTGSPEAGWRIVEWLVVQLNAAINNDTVMMISLLDMNDDVLASSRADVDELTGLLNRSGFRAELEETTVPSALAFIDLDRFKEVNDRFGHAVGDNVLKIVASRLQSTTRSQEVLGRIHGDEFVALIPGVESSEVAFRITQRLIASLEEPILIDGHSHRISASGGYTLLLPGQNVDEMMHRADVAMYEAKRQSGSHVAAFDEELVARLDVWRKAADALPTAFAGGSGLHFEYQPVVRTASCEVLGVEALLRWRLEDGTRIPPPIALSLFESRGLMEVFTQWSIRQLGGAIATMDSWSDRRLQIGLNLSPMQLALPNLVNWLTDMTKSAGIGNRRLVIEVTETEALADHSAAHQATQTLLDRGFLVSLDDFGAGWSTLDQLAATPANSLKIDRRLVATVENPRVRTVLRSLKTITDEFKMAMVVEGVETPEQLIFFNGLGATAAQGWLLSRSVPLHELRAAMTSAEQIAEEHLGPVSSLASMALASGS